MRDADYINHLKNIEQKAYDTASEVRTEIRGPNNVYDARVSTFYFIAQVVRWFKLCLIFKNEYLNNPRNPHWYNNIYISYYKQQHPENGYVPFKGENGHGLLMPNNNDYRLILVKEFEQVMLVAYSQVLYSIIESKFRLFLMTVYPDALEKRKQTGWFSNVYKCLLEESKKTQYKDLIEFFSLIRNTIHNNGRYMNPKRPHVQNPYRGNPVEFEHNSMVDLPGGAFTWLLRYITPDVIDMMKDIILNTDLKDIPSIPEPVMQS